MLCFIQTIVIRDQKERFLPSLSLYLLQKGRTRVLPCVCVYIQ